MMAPNDVGKLMAYAGVFVALMFIAPGLALAFAGLLSIIHIVNNKTAEVILAVVLMIFLVGAIVYGISIPR